jgi:hypothetical protein
MAELNLHQRYEFKPSRIALGFQFFCLGLMLLLWFVMFNIWVCLFLLLLALFSLKVFRQRKKIRSLERLDLNEWVIQYTDSEQSHRTQIKQMIDHHLYIVVYFYEKKHENLVIWQDQMHYLDWKSLKSRVRLH